MRKPMHFAGAKERCAGVHRPSVTRFLLPLVLLLSGAAHGQVTNRPAPQTPATNPPAPNAPASQAKVGTKGEAALVSAPADMMLKAFRQVLGREPVRGELQVVTKHKIGEMTFYCRPPAHIAKPNPAPMFEWKEWDCVTPIEDWLRETPEGLKEYQTIYARALKEVFGIEKLVTQMEVKPSKASATNPLGQTGYYYLVEVFTDYLYGTTPAGPYAPASSPLMDALEGVAKAMGGGSGSEGEPTAPAPKKTLSLEATVERAFLQALKRKPTEAEVKSLTPIFIQEKATFRRMIEILQGFDSLKKIK